MVHFLRRRRYLQIWGTAISACFGRWQCLFLIGLVVALFFGAWPAGAQTCRLPTENELTSLDPPPPSGLETWTLQEKWVWKQTLAGATADFNQLYCQKEPLDPSAGDQVWESRAKPDQPRLLSERFLVDVLTNKHFAEAVPSRGLRIVGALFAAPIDLSGVNFGLPIWLDRSRFVGPVSLIGAQLGFLSFEGSTFQGAVRLHDARIGVGLNTERGTFKDYVGLLGATIGGAFSAHGSTFEAILNMESLTIEQHLLLRDGATFKGDVNLRGARIFGQLAADGAIFEATLDMDSLVVEQSLFLNQAATFKGGVNMTGAKVGGQLDASGSTFQAALNMDGLAVERNLFLRDGATFNGDVILIGARSVVSLMLEVPPSRRI